MRLHLQEDKIDKRTDPQAFVGSQTAPVTVHINNLTRLITRTESYYFTFFILLDELCILFYYYLVTVDNGVVHHNSETLQ